MVRGNSVLRILTSVLLAGLIGLCASAGAVVIDPEQESLALGPHLRVIPDPRSALHFDAVASGRHDDRALPASNRAPNLGYVRHPFWVRLELENSTDHPLQRILVLRRGTKHRQDIWVDAGGAVRRLRIGRGGTVSGDLTSRHAVVRLELPAHASVAVSIRFEARSGAVLDYFLTSERALAREDLPAFWVFGLLFGVSLTIAFYMLFLYAVARQPVYLWFAGLALFGQIYQMHFEGFAFVGLWGAWQLTGNYVALYSALLANMSMLLFLRAMIDAPRILPRADRWLFKPTLVLMLPAFLLFPAYWWIANAIAAMGAIVVTFSLGVAVIVCVVRGQVPVKTTAVAAFIQCLAVSLFAFKQLGLLPDNPVIAVLYAATAVLALLSFVIALSQHVQLIAEKNRLALKLNEARLELSVAERTADILKLGEIGKELTATLDIEQAFERVYSQVSARLDAHVFAISIYRADDDSLHDAYVVEGGERDAGAVYAMSERARPAVWCVRERRELITVNQQQLLDTMQVPLSPKSGGETESIVYLPLIVEERVIGCLSVQSPRTHAYSAAQLEFLRVLASYTAIALNNAQSYTRLNQAMTQTREALDHLHRTQAQLLVSEKLAAAGQLTAGMAHEINNPNNFIAGAAQNLQAEHRRLQQFLFDLAGADADPEVLEALRGRFVPLAEQLETICEGAQRIRDIVRDLRTFSRLDEAEFKAISVVESLRATLNLIGTRYRLTARFEIDFAADPMIECFPAKLNQVFMNLLVNACQAVEMRQRSDDADFSGLIRVSTRERRGMLEVEVADNGCGMTAAVQQRVFEPFFTTRGVGEGSGLGLSTSYGIVLEHRGQIEIESSPGVGSRFTVRLPIG